MRMMSTAVTAKYRLRILSAVKLYVDLPKPVIGVVGDPPVLALVWMSDGKLATIMQSSEQPAMFACRTFRHLTPKSSLDVDLEALDGPPLLMEFLDAVADWLV
jgi:hypothetical protein